MDNPVVIRAAEVAQAAGYATLRFNFRGAGGSEGVHDKGRGEQDDVRAAMAALAARLPAGSRVGVIGLLVRRRDGGAGDPAERSATLRSA